MLWQAVVSDMDDKWWYELTDVEKATQIHPYDRNYAAAPKEPEEELPASMADAGPGGLDSIISQAAASRRIEMDYWLNQCKGGPRSDEGYFFDNLEVTELRTRASAR